MKQITMDFMIYEAELATAHFQGFRAGVQGARRLLVEMASGASNEILKAGLDADEDGPLFNLIEDSQLRIALRDGMEEA